MDDEYEYIGRVIEVIKTWRGIERAWKYEKQKNFNERLNLLSAWNLAWVESFLRISASRIASLNLS